LASSKSSFTGKRAWTIKTSELRTKVLDCLLYLCTFGGVSLAIYSMMHINNSLGLLVFGVALTPISVLIRDRRGAIVTIRVNPVKRFAFLLGSTVGASAFITGLGYLLLGAVKISGVYIILGLVLSILSRYVPKKNNFTGIMLDYLLQISSFAGVTLVATGLILLNGHWLMGLSSLVLGTFLTPSSLVLRERVLFRRRDKKIKRKFFSMVAVTLGMGCSIFGGLSLSHGDWILSFVLLEGVLLMLGGAIVNDNKTLISLKDIV
jgi:hypothetical protein